MGFGLDCGEGVAVVGCKAECYDDCSDQGMHIINHFSRHNNYHGYKAQQFY